MTKGLTGEAIVGIVLACLASAQAAVVFVDVPEADCGNDRAWVAAGTYQPDRDCTHPTGSVDCTATFRLIDGVALRGGFADTESQLAQPNWVTNITILDDNRSGSVVASAEEDITQALQGYGQGPIKAVACSLDGSRVLTESNNTARINNLLTR